jgi:predicted alpha/beta superfamily hydrolase
MHDGQNLQPTPNSPPDWMGNWSVATHINDAINAETIDQVFVVGPYNTADRINEYTYSVDPEYGGGQGDLYLDFLTQTLLPRVKAAGYNICTEKQCLGIMGSSLGGLISCYAGVTRPTVYGTVGCMSSSFWWNNGDFLSTIMPRLTQSSSQQYYVDCGDSGDTDDDLADTSVVSSAFVASQKGLTLGINFYWYLQRGGQHNEDFWSSRFHHPLAWLYGHAAVWNNDITAKRRHRDLLTMGSP